MLVALGLRECSPWSAVVVRPLTNNRRRAVLTGASLSRACEATCVKLDGYIVCDFLQASLGGSDVAIPFSQGLKITQG